MREKEETEGSDTSDDESGIYLSPDPEGMRNKFKEELTFLLTVKVMQGREYERGKHESGKTTHHSHDNCGEKSHSFIIASEIHQERSQPYRHHCPDGSRGP